MSSSISIQVILLAAIVLIVQIFIPVVKFYNLEIIPDLLIIFMVYVGYHYGRFEAIILGFLFGIIQDFVTQVELFGVMAFAKSLIGYGLGTLALYKRIWSKNFRMFFIFIVYFLHFFIYYYIKFNGEPVSNVLILQIMFIHSILCFFILWILDQAIIKNGVSK